MFLTATQLLYDLRARDRLNRYAVGDDGNAVGVFEGGAWRVLYQRTQSSTWVYAGTDPLYPIPDADDWVE